MLNAHVIIIMADNAIIPGVCKLYVPKKMYQFSKKINVLKIDANRNKN